MVNALRRHEWQVAAWAIFALAFVFAGALPLRDGLRQQSRVSDQGAMNSTDALFLQTLGLEDGTRQIIALMRTLPKDGPVALVLPEEDSLSGAAIQLSTLCWPRPAPMIRVPASGNAQLAEHIRATHAAAAFFLGQEVPAGFPQGEALNAQLRFVPLP